MPPYADESVPICSEVIWSFTCFQVLAAFQSQKRIQADFFDGYLARNAAEADKHQALVATIRLKSHQASRRADATVPSSSGKTPVPALTVEFVQHIDARKRAFVDAGKQIAALATDMDREDVSWLTCCT